MASKPRSARQAASIRYQKARKTERDRSRDRTRPPGEPGYDADWQRLRLAYLAEHPLCECEHCAGGLKQIRAATVVDHIVSFSERPELRLEWSNLRAMAKPCHDRRTALEQAFAGDTAYRHPEWLRPSLIPLTIVCGPPAAGKSTHVFLHAGKDDLVIDLDQIATALSGDMTAAWDRRRWLKPALRTRNHYLGMVSAKGSRWPSAWFIVQAPEPERRQWWHDKLRPTRIVVLETPVDECWRRITADPSRAARADIQKAAVQRWWERYQRRPGDEVVKVKRR